MSKIIQLKDNMDNVYPKIYRKVLWTNPNPTRSFSAQIINLDSEEYDVLEIFYKHWYDNPYILCQRTLKGTGTMLFTRTGAGEWIRRIVNQNTNTTLSFADATNNDGVIPLYVIGYKY